jgi:hypothetical protein
VRCRPEERAVGEYLCSGYRFVDEHELIGDLGRDAHDDTDGGVIGCRARRVGR